MVTYLKNKLILCQVKENPCQHSNRRQCLYLIQDLFSPKLMLVTLTGDKNFFLLICPFSENCILALTIAIYADAMFFWYLAQTHQRIISNLAFSFIANHCIKVLTRRLARWDPDLSLAQSQQSSSYESSFCNHDCRVCRIVLFQTRNLISNQKFNLNWLWNICQTK